jgi:EAL domain-containing protein (putative c-di-GMP-specific phosphodiesterase class I)
MTPIVVDGRQVSTQASVGIAMVNRGAEADELMRHADIAMYTAKRNGKGRFQFFEPEMGESVSSRHRLKEDLRAAVTRREFQNYYQTMVDLTTGEVVGVEALVRWNHPSAGIVNPDDFIPLAEETGVILDVGRFVLSNACRDAARWRGLLPNLSVSVNISACQLDDEGFIDDVRRSLTAAGLPGSALILEITESMVMGDTEVVVGRLNALKALGIQLAIDDFGTGYSSLSQMRQLPIDIVKIPKPFVDDMNVSDGGLDLVKAITRLSQALGLEVVAEGIEAADQYESLQTLACAVGQGFYFGRPVPAIDMTRFLTGQSPARRFGSTHPSSSSVFVMRVPS